MALTFIRTTECRRDRPAGNVGEVAEIVNRELCGARNVLGMLRWLRGAERLDATSPADAHQLVYLMEGEGGIPLQGKDYPVAKGAGIYLGPAESAAIRPGPQGTLKLFHLVVPRVKDA